MSRPQDPQEESTGSAPADPLRTDTGDPGDDRSDLIDMPPADVDADAVRANLPGDEDAPGADEAASHS